MHESQPGQPPRPPSSGQPTVDAGKLWAGGVATAIVAALIAVVGIMVARGVLDIYVFAPKDKGAWEAASAVSYAAASALAALLATALMHALLLATPRPTMFFGWIMFLVAVIGATWPFTTGAALENQVATAVLNALIVVAIWSLVASSAQRSLASGSHVVR
jgi:Family of unknown function (DUF6069)